MRKYEAIWKRIKEKGVAKVIATPRIISTIKKGVIKEKYNDDTFRLELDLLAEHAMIESTFDTKSNTITFILRRYKRQINLGDL